MRIQPEIQRLPPDAAIAGDVDAAAIRRDVGAPGLVGVGGVAKVDRRPPAAALPEGDAEPAEATGHLAVVEDDERLVRRDGGIVGGDGGVAQAHEFRALVAPSRRAERQMCSRGAGGRSA